ncbi:40S ribosomal protein S3a [Tanacetum coccineum]
MGSRYGDRLVSSYSVDNVQAKRCTRECGDRLRHRQVKIRRKMREIMVNQAQSCDLNELVQKFIPESIGREIEKATSSIYLLVPTNGCKLQFSLNHETLSFEYGITRKGFKYHPLENDKDLDKLMESGQFAALFVTGGTPFIRNTGHDNDESIINTSNSTHIVDKVDRLLYFVWLKYKKIALVHGKNDVILTDVLFNKIVPMYDESAAFIIQKHGLRDFCKITLRRQGEELVVRNEALEEFTKQSKVLCLLDGVSDPLLALMEREGVVHTHDLGSKGTDMQKSPENGQKSANTDTEREEHKRSRGFKVKAKKSQPSVNYESTQSKPLKDKIPNVTI